MKTSPEPPDEITDEIPDEDSYQITGESIRLCNLMFDSDGLTHLCSTSIEVVRRCRS